MIMNVLFMNMPTMLPPKTQESSKESLPYAASTHI